MSTIRTDTWIISLPDDWEEKEGSNDGQLHFESSDGTKAFYIATWNIGANDTRSAEEVTSSFKKFDLESLHAMEGRLWKTLEDSVRSHSNGTEALIDNLDTENSYRIAVKLLSYPPIVVRASFHDYLCENINDSRESLNPIIESLGFHVGAV